MRHVLHGPRLSPLASSLVLAAGLLITARLAVIAGHGAPPNDRARFAQGGVESEAAIRQRIAANQPAVTDGAAMIEAMRGEAAA